MNASHPPPDLNPVPAESSASQFHYARWVEIGTRICLVLLAASFALYVTGILEAHVPLSRLPGLWSLPVDGYLAQTGLGAGWSWIAHIPKGDMLNFAVVAVLASITLLAYARAALAFLFDGQRLYAALALAQMAVLAAAILGIGAGH